MKALSLHTLFDSQTELLLLLVLIAFFLIGSLFTLVITLIKRQKKITLVKTKKVYESQIESYILRFLFENDEQATADFIKNPNSKKTLFKKLTMKYCLIMHQNYTGTIQTSILDFLYKTNMILYSREKIKSNIWKHKVEAIRDLSTLNDRGSIPKIQKLLSHSNKKIAIESIIALIKFDGIGTLSYLKTISFPIDDWSQALILSVIKNNKIPYDDSIKVLQQSKNQSIQLLASRIIKFYN